MNENIIMFKNILNDFAWFVWNTLVQIMSDYIYRHNMKWNEWQECKK